jgi:hypothetical protein
VGQAPELEAQLDAPETDLLDTNRVGWQLLHFMRDSLTSLEEQATRVLAGQIAGFIAIWTQLHTFDRGLPRSLVWAAWGFVLAALAWLAPLVTPRRLARFWSGLPVKGALLRGDHFDPDAEARLITDLTEAAERQMARIRYGLGQSIALGCFGLGLAVVGHVIEKT